MRWFKHISTSQHDETLSELMDKFGAEGYGVWWIVLEKIAQLMDESGRCFARFSLKVWATSAKVSVKRFQNIVEFLEKKSSFILNYEDNYLTIECTNLLKYRDEWTERKAKSRDKLPSNSRDNAGVTPGLLKHDPDTESDTDTDKNTVVSSEPNGSSDTTCLQSSAEELQTATSNEISEAGTDPPSKIDNCPHQAIIDLYHKHIPGGTKVRVWSEDSRKKLRRRWREEAERQSLEWWDKFFYNVSQLDFFMGRTEIDYQTNLDALVSPKMFNRIISDHYWQIQQKKQKTKKY